VGRLARKELTTLWRRYEALGGWLAHLSNFTPGAFDLDHDQAVRPRWVFVWIGLLVVIAVAGGLIAADLEVAHPMTGSQQEAGLGISLAASLTALGMALGLRAGYVPYVPQPTTRATSVSPEDTARRFAAVEVRVTGILDAHRGRRYYGRKRRYRERPAVLERHSDGVLTVRVKSSILGPSMLPESMSLSRRFCGYAALEPGMVSDVTRGTAYLATRAKAAIRLNWIYGPVTLTFADEAARDDVFTRLRATPLSAFAHVG